MAQLHGSIAWYYFTMSADEALLRHLFGGIVLQPGLMRLARSEDAQGIFFRHPSGQVRHAADDRESGPEHQGGAAPHEALRQGRPNDIA